MRLRAWLSQNKMTILKGVRFACFKDADARDIDLRLHVDEKYNTCAAVEAGKPTEHENMGKLLSEGYARCYKTTSNMGGTLSPP
jgi:hypothetical protein